MHIRIDDGDTMLPIEVPDERVNASSRVVIGFPDRVKGVFQPTAHRRPAIPSILEESTRAGVKDERITLVCGIGLHRKNTMEGVRRGRGSATRSARSARRSSDADARGARGLEARRAGAK